MPKVTPLCYITAEESGKQPPYADMLASYNFCQRILTAPQGRSKINTRPSGPYGDNLFERPTPVVSDPCAVYASLELSPVVNDRIL